MRNSWPLFTTLLFLIAIIAPFNNCATVTTPADRVDQAPDHKMLDDGANLNVQIENKGSATFDPQTGSILLTGSCNATAFQQNVVWWSIELNGKKVWDSYLAGGDDKLGHCARNKFSILVTSPCKQGTACQTFADSTAAVTVRAHISGIYGEDLNKLEASSSPLTVIR